jgi:16S rRNA (adenine1518-N6/adenine1519-N6)-dimethyltransferase
LGSAYGTARSEEVAAPRKRERSLFASFSSEKEGSFLTGDPLAEPLREVIARHALAARKALGQHFLLDLNLTARIAAAAPLAGAHVIEVGPGPGGLTRALLTSDAASVTAIEIDRRAVAALAELQPAAGARLAVIEADALGLDYPALTPAPRVIVANLPYHIATPLLIGWLRTAGAFACLVLMFQLEVAERICAAPGSPAYGRLAVLAQFVCHAELVLRLPPAAFTPPPAVASAVVRLTPHANQPPPALRAALERVSAYAFGQRRKMLRRALAPLGGAAFLAKAGIDPTRRAETLSIAEFTKLARVLMEETI